MPNPKGWRWEDVWRASLGKDEPDRPEPHPGPRVPTDEEYEEWVSTHDIEGERPFEVREHLRSIDPRRWRRMQLDIKWMKKELRKMGLNPEDARWYL